MKTDFETMGGAYHREGDYLLPDLVATESPNIGVWGQRRLAYLEEHQKALYTAMLLGGKLNAHLEEVDKSATEMYDRLLEQFKKAEGVTESLKTADQMAWCQHMNSIHNRVTEIVRKELIYP